MTDKTSQAARGTFECPICGMPTPHYHGPGEQIPWHMQYRPIFEASIHKRIRRSDPSYYLFSVDAVQITGIAHRLAYQGADARQPGDWAELRRDGGYVCDWLQTLWEIFKDGVRAELSQHAQQAVESEREKVMEEVAQALIDAGYGEAYEVVYKLQSQQPMAVESEREKVLQSIREAVEQYNQDLHDRKHGGVAMDKAWWKIIAALGTIKSQQPAQADKEKPCATIWP